MSLATTVLHESLHLKGTSAEVCLGGCKYHIHTVENFEWRIDGLKAKTYFRKLVEGWCDLIRQAKRNCSH